MAAELTAQTFKGEKKMVDLDGLFTVVDLQQRDLSDPHDIDDYDALTKDVAEAVKDKEDIEPILVIEIPEGTIKKIDGKPVKPGQYVCEGFRRAKGFKAAGRAKIPAIVRVGTWEDAVDVSTSANIGNKAIPRKPQDKRRALLSSLVNRNEMSNRWHADHCDVGQELVAKLRPEADKLFRLYSDKAPSANGDGAESTRVSKSGKRQAAHKKAVKKKAKKLIEMVDWSVWESRFGSLVRFIDDAAEITGTKSKDKESNYQQAMLMLHDHGKIVKAWMDEIKKMPVPEKKTEAVKEG